MPRLFSLILLLAAGVCAQTPFLPLQDLKPGMRGVGKTIFAGDRVEEFQAEILGVLENIGPKQSLILARLSGGPLDRTNVLQGMSGSPVYVGGKLIGAVAMAFPWAKESIAGIRPIEEMVRAASGPSEPPRRTSIALTDTDVTRGLPKPREVLAGDSRLVDVATPVSFGGFTATTIEHFAPQLRALGLEPRQGVQAGGRVDQRMGAASALQPGSMISVQLMGGDMSMGADGTITHIDGKKIYAFGHRFLSVGSTALPFSRSEVLALLPTLSTSFKISSPKELMGTITQDRNTTIVGELGRRTPMVPVSITVSRGGKKLESYDIRMVNDRFLAPLLVQMAVFSTIDATERTVGASSLRVTGEIGLEGTPEPIKLNNMYAADNGSALMASLSAAVPLAWVLQSGFDTLAVRKVELEIESFSEKKQLQIDQVTAARNSVRPGEKVELFTVMVGDNGAEVTRKVDYEVPVGAPPGPLFFTVADGATTNMQEYRIVAGTQPKSVDQVIATVNSMRANTKAYVRVWRADPAFQMEGADFPDPPPSVSMILGGAQPGAGTIQQTRNAKVAELEIAAGDVVISGSKTIQVEVKE
ncbi:MAG TPA: hypothetical protein VN442_14950 [Bryobacteraceae bacterium]|nr:hypothetical protein [Bryobacteraceae bacterium]